ncbi:DEAD-box ATP-dependent RNA helicase 31-like [Phalaenopsis equestris]|uniref:DEAD-box ATP-dependent RNA helicase 31-like n=1 Tax=Phalaenopsis equestris TaxID=78828 RepID=UPI0009E2BA3A|nr:DEAD-box ATP-dependent RNA helicase 31-like [Phalaenopsis equestris]
MIATGMVGVGTGCSIVVSVASDDHLASFTTAHPLPIRLFSTASIHRGSPCSSLSGVFAKLKLKNLPFSSTQLLLVYHREYSGGRTFSARPARSGTRDTRRGQLRPGSVSGQSKSLIEDEEELSDWISDLKADSFRTRHSSEDEFSGRSRGKQEIMDRDRNWLKSKGQGRDSRSAVHGRPSSRRNRDSDSDGYSSRSQRASSLRRRIDSDDDADDFRSGIGNGRGNRPWVSKNSRKGLGDRHGASSSFNKRGGGDLEIGGRVGERMRSPILAVQSEEEEEDSDDDMSDADNDFFGDKEDRKDSVANGAFEKGGSLTSSDGDIVKAIPKTSVPAGDSYLTESRFDQFSLSPLSLKGVKAAGYERMTLVQEATLPVILKGKDVLAKAKTGTGKTVAFLLPAIELVTKQPPPDRDNRRPPINVLVICPTRELADQAAAEASKLLRYHASIGVQVVMGGTRLALEQKRMQANPCQVLVATPGRFRDHMENTPGFTSRLTGVKVLVLDEADRLLDMGFRKDIEKIVAELPKQRQTLLFSATVSDEVRQICYIAMKRDNEFINTVEEGSEETHSQVMQMHLIAPLDKQFSILYGILTDHIAEDVDYKVIVFCTTAMVTKLVADLLAELNLNVREMHSRKAQNYRTRVSKEFRESKGLILVSSDVSARGVDYPDVTLVVQLGVPADRDQYIHRLGRTGRKGKEGKGVLILAPWEDFFLDNIRDLPIAKAPVPLVDPNTRKKVERALAHVELKSKESAYQAWLGYYNSIKNVAREKSKLVLLANEFSSSMGLDNPPAIPIIVLRKMGLNNVPGLRAK